MGRYDFLGTCDVVILSGGNSDEREIALASGRAVERALGQLDPAPRLIDFVDMAEPGAAGRIEAQGYDVAFIAMHGKGGEDGCVQGLCETIGLPYAFSGVAASAVATNKDLSKHVYERAGIPTPRGLSFASPDEASPEKIVAELGLPLFVKPSCNGSSYGITRVTDASQIPAAIELACAGGDLALVEECIEGTEVTVPVLGNDDPEALPVVEVVMGEGAEFYDLKVKYEPSELHHVIPARLPEDVYARVQELAVAAHVALGCRGVSRSDFIITADGSPCILETNTIPGMTETSLLPDSARHAGIEFPELCARIIELALDRVPSDSTAEGA